MSDEGTTNYCRECVHLQARCVRLESQLAAAQVREGELKQTLMAAKVELKAWIADESCNGRCMAEHCPGCSTIRVIKRIDAALTQLPAEGHQWVRSGVAGSWWCERCHVCGGDGKQPADIGPCKGQQAGPPPNGVCVLCSGTGKATGHHDVEQYYRDDPESTTNPQPKGGAHESGQASLDATRPPSATRAGGDSPDAYAIAMRVFADAKEAMKRDRQPDDEGPPVIGTVTLAGRGKPSPVPEQHGGEGEREEQEIDFLACDAIGGHEFIGPICKHCGFKKASKTTQPSPATVESHTTFVATDDTGQVYKDPRDAVVDAARWLIDEWVAGGGLFYRLIELRKALSAQQGEGEGR